MLELLTVAAEEGHHVELFMPPIMFGVLALVALGAFAGITWMCRNAAASHPENSEVSPFVPFVHAGGSKHE